MSIAFSLSSNAAEITRKLRGFPPQMAERIRQAMDDQNQLTIGYMAVNYLSGPRPEKLGRVHSHLVNSVNASPAVTSGNEIQSSIGTNVVYAKPHELGFDGIVQVKGFTRKNPAGNISSTQGGTVSLHSGRIRKTKLTKTASGISVVKAHSMHMKIPARPFLRPSIEDRTPNYSAAVSAAIVTAWSEGGAS